ncbi:hypothetical protein K8S17_06895 [bacterium]|nr:hypothetical protein [bacterium]
MREELERLLKLQEIDVVLAEATWEAEGLPARIVALEEQLTTADARVTDGEEALHQITKDRLRYEGDLRDQSAKLEDLRSRQLIIKTNEEYAALTHEIEYMTNTISGTEDVVLGLLEDSETKTKDLEGCRADADGARGEIEQQIAALKSELDELRERVALQNDERTRISMHVDERILLKYDRILISKGDSALVPLVNGTCTGCYKRLPPQSVIEIKRGDRFVECDSCGRILYWGGDSADE